ncbi:hypothetical protein CEXT_582891 [Caerostris extrusa]|uniref:Uncharacterized protein n=1 Tax=Caerostris extrusa TaxID=172846 RepID=A0AAV4MYZ9_CAEEX|nr:hypothetical protein CEXT_582891 [Caerostris extrusa]
MVYFQTYTTKTIHGKDSNLKLVVPSELSEVDTNNQAQKNIDQTRVLLDIVLPKNGFKYSLKNSCCTENTLYVRVGICQQRSPESYIADSGQSTIFMGYISLPRCLEFLSPIFRRVLRKGKERREASYIMPSSFPTNPLSPFDYKWRGGE